MAYACSLNQITPKVINRSAPKLTSPRDGCLWRKSRAKTGAALLPRCPAKRSVLQICAADQSENSKAGGLFGGFKRLIQDLGTSAARLTEGDQISNELAFITQGSEWNVALSVYEREPTTPLSQSKAGKCTRVNLGLRCSFMPPDEGYFPYRGEACVSSSRYFQGGKGAYWIEDDEGQFFKFTLNVSEDVSVGGAGADGRELVLIPKGQVYFNAKMKPTYASDESRSNDVIRSMELVDGVATIKQDVKANFLGQDYSGIMAEYIVIGTFSGQVA
mmetsp:Transcript_5437/g.6261  ORF Transcript_5437/g.6261 Transcript_5437/m.6261 type:complete len:274 (+) Transcript_5437:408-1229(+)